MALNNGGQPMPESRESQAVSEHTAIPWIAEQGRIYEGTGSPILVCYEHKGVPKAGANAALIVRAVNSHAALVEAATALLNTLPKPTLHYCSFCRYKLDSEPLHRPDCVWVALDAALALARGES